MNAQIELPDGNSLVISLSVGLLEAADQAMYQAERQGRGRWKLATAEPLSARSQP